MSERTRQHLDTFWELIDEILNTVLFILIGFEVLVLAFSAHIAMAALLTIPMVLLARLVCVGVPIRLLALGREFSPGVRGPEWECNRHEPSLPALRCGPARSGRRGLAA